MITGTNINSLPHPQGVDDNDAKEIHSILNAIASALPPLPSIIRYYEDFNDKVHSIDNPAQAKVFSVYVNGSLVSVRFDDTPNDYGQLLRGLFVFLLANDFSISTIVHRVNGLKALAPTDIERLITAGPLKVRDTWAIYLARAMPSDAYYGAKSLLQMCCRYRIIDWSDSYIDFIAFNLPLPYKDKYATVRSGDAFLTLDEEACIIRHIDSIVEILQDKEQELTDRDLIDSAMLICSYQFGMRPVQIAMVTIQDVRLWNGSNVGHESVHLTFRMVKQRSIKKLKPLQRRVKYEWVPIFVELCHRLALYQLTGSERLFMVASASEVSRRIAALLGTLIDREASAIDLRHSAAQRLVDAGASQEELSEFMGHTDITTGLVYFETSANQAERVNKALGASEIYQRIARIAHDRFISAEELANLKDEQQIGGVPHGIPIVGIGGCGSGQQTCPYNPIMSCYGCRKFMPISELAVHEKVLADFREVVRFFLDASRGDSASPTYLQLQRTISEVQAVIEEIQGSAV